MPEKLTLCVFLWAVDGKAGDLADYEDKVLALMPEYDGKVVSRFRNFDDDGPTEIQVLEFPSDADVDAFVNDERRLELAADRDRSIARTEVFRVQPV